MTGEDSLTCSSIKICPYFRVGYCKYKETCKHFHPKENCGERKCRNKTCNKRHRRPCKFGNRCTRINFCEFLHNEQKSSKENASTDINHEMEEIIKSKDAKIEELSEKIKTLEDSIASMNEKFKIVTSIEQTIKETQKKMVSTAKKVDKNCKKVEELEDRLEQDRFIKSENLSVDKKEEAAKSPTKSLKCDRCPFGGTDESDLKRHKDMHPKDNTLALQPDTWLGRCGICKFRTMDRAHYKRHMETFVPKTKVY